MEEFTEEEIGTIDINVEEKAEENEVDEGLDELNCEMDEAEGENWNEIIWTFFYTRHNPQYLLQIVKYMNSNDCTALKSKIAECYYILNIHGLVWMMKLST